MIDELAVIEVPTEQPVSSFHLAARNPREMAAAQADLAVWFKHKSDLLEREVSELEAAVAEAKAHKWKASTLQSQLCRARSRQRFYGKCLLAVQAGFTIIPNIPVDVFAVRVQRETPKFERETLATTSAWQQPGVANTKPGILPSGEGRYVSNLPIVDRREGPNRAPNAKEGEIMKIATVVEFGDEVEFPVIAAMPEVMSATAQAMALRIFDDIGVSPQRARRGDPLIIGRIHSRQPRKWSDWPQDKMTSFLIAWHVDLRTL